MDPIAIASKTGVSIQTAAKFLQPNYTFIKSNIEKFLEHLLKTEKDLTAIGKREYIKRYFLAILNKVAHEPNQEKVKLWCNATIQIVSGFDDPNFKDNFIRTLDDLTIFDLKVLANIYEIDFEKNHIVIAEIMNNFNNKNTNQALILQSIKRLVLHNLISELGAISNKNQATIGSIFYIKNELGPSFLKFISKS